jgi:hypothetical protein
MATCRACHHPEHTRIDRELIAGKSLRAIAAWSGTSTGGLMRHKQHVKEVLKAAAEAASPTHGGKLVAQLEEVVRIAKQLLGHAARSGQFSAANGALANIIRCSELMARASGELATPGNVGGIHFHSSKTLNINVGANDDKEIAQLVGEATAGFDLSEFMRLKKLAQQNEKPALTITTDSQPT